MTYTIDPEHPERALSITEAARERPDGLCLRTPEGDISFSEAARRAALIKRTLTPPPAGRPYVMQARTDVESILTFYALLEAQVPMLLLSPKLTEAETRAYVEAAQRIDEPLEADAAVVIFTSGTTGASKPAILSRRALAANALAVSRHIAMTKDDVWLLSLSPARVGGLGILTRSLACRSGVALGAKYSAQGFVSELSDMHVTIASLVPAMVIDVLEHFPQWQPPRDFRLLLVGGSACPASLRRRALAARIPVVTTYAMTETASSVGMSPYEDRLTENFCADRALEGVEFRLTDKNEVLVRGPMLMNGYWGRSRLTPGAWHATGDIAREDGLGGLRIQARQSEVMITGGEKVYPAEVELALEEIPGVKAALAAGIPDEKWGVIVGALLVPSPGMPRPTGEAIARGVRAQLAAYKCPRRIAWVEELPRTREGKPRREPSVFEGLALETLHYTNL